MLNTEVYRNRNLGSNLFNLGASKTGDFLGYYKDIFEKASDAVRLTTMIQHRISLTRRFFLSSMLTQKCARRFSCGQKVFGEQFLAKIKETTSACQGSY